MEQRKTVKVEDVLEKIGGFGKFQKIFTFITLYPEMGAAMIILSPVFTGSSSVRFSCDDNVTELVQSDNDNRTQSYENGGFPSIVQEWDLVCSRAWIVELITSFQMVGMMVGATTASLLADRIGRNTVGYMFARCGMGILGMLPALANGPLVYAMTRFLAGLGMGGVFVVGLVHFMEFLTPEWRTLCGALSMWPLGEMLLALLAYLIPNWRYLTVATGLPALLVLLFYPFFLESPRWLLTRKRTTDAHNVLKKVASWNNRPPPEFSEMQELQASVLEEESEVLRGMDGLKQIWRTPSLRNRLLILTLGSVTNTMVYYGVSFSAKNLSGSPYLNMFYMGIADVIGCIATLMFNNRLGRKRTYMLYIVLASIAITIALVFTALTNVGESYPMLVTAAALLGRFGVVASWGALGCWTLESFPTAVRSSCLGFKSFCAYLVGTLAPQTVLLSKIHPSIPYVLYCCLTVSCCILASTLKDMTDVPLEDIVKDKKIKGKLEN